MGKIEKIPRSCKRAQKSVGSQNKDTIGGVDIENNFIKAESQPEGCRCWNFYQIEP